MKINGISLWSIASLLRGVYIEEASLGNKDEIEKFYKENELLLDDQRKAVLIPKFVGYNDQQICNVLNRFFNEGNFLIGKDYIILPLNIWSDK